MEQTNQVEASGTLCPCGCGCTLPMSSRRADSPGPELCDCGFGCHAFVPELNARFRGIETVFGH